jgi:chromosome segregation ATPase
MKKPSVIAHALRTIRLEYKSKARLSALEEEALRRYVLLHDSLLPILQEWEAMLLNWQTIEAPQKLLEQQLVELEQELRPYKHLAGFTPVEIEQMTDLEESYQLTVNDLINNGHALKARFDVHFDAIKQLSADYHDLEERAEELEESYDDFRENFFSPIIQQYETMEIEIISFDSDFDDFNGYMDKESNLWRKTSEARYVVIEAYNRLVHGIDKAFKRIDRVGEEINVMHPGELPGEAHLN